MRPVTPPLSVLLVLVLWRQERPVATRTTDPRTDEALYRQYAEGDHRAFRELLARHGDAVYRFLGRQMGDWEIAADVTQDVFLKVIAAAQDFRGDASFRTYLFQVARNAAIDATRSRNHRPDGDARSLEAPSGRVPGAPPLGERLAGESEGNDHRTLSGELCRALEAGLERLPSEQREAFLLREMEGLSFPEIGAIQGVSLDAARGRVLLAIKSLRRSLDGFGGAAMTQAQARQRLLDYVYGEMTPGDRVAFEAIAGQDPELQAELDDVAFVRRAVSGLLGDGELPGRARRRILAAARRAIWQRAWARWWVAVRASLLTPAFLGTAAVVVAVGLAVPWFREQGRVPPGTTTDIEAQTGVPASGGQATPREINGTPTPEARPREFVEPRPGDAARLLSDARNARAAGRNTEALALCNRALAAEPSGDLLADVLAAAAEVARSLSLNAEADNYLDRLQRLPGGAERIARIRGGP